MSEPRFPYERSLSAFDRIVAAAQRELILHVRQALRADLSRRGEQLLQLARVTAVLDQLGAYVDPEARRMVADAYDQAGARTGQQVLALGVRGPVVGVNPDAVAVLQDSVVSSLRDGRVRVGRQVQDVYARAGRQAATRAVLGAEGSPRSAARRLASDLLKDRQIARMAGGPGFVDAAGRTWGIDRYSAMTVRTVTREAVVQGSVDRMVGHGVTLARVSTHGGACKICVPFEGKLIDLAGNGEGFGGEVPITGPLPPYHPNCAHTISPVAVRIERLRRELQGTA